MTGQGEKGDVPGLAHRRLGHHPVEAVESNMVGHPPVVCGALSRRKGVLAESALVAGGKQIAVGVGKVDVAAVEERSGIARPAQRTSNGGQGRTLGGQFHHTHIGK